MEVAVVLALHVLDERVDVVGLDGLHQRLGLPAQPRALAAHAHRRQVLELGQRPRFCRAVAAEDVPAHAAVVLADDKGKDKAARLALQDVGVVDPVRPGRRDLAHRLVLGGRRADALAHHLGGPFPAALPLVLLSPTLNTAELTRPGTKVD